MEQLPHRWTEKGGMPLILVRGDGLAVEFLEAMLHRVEITHRARDPWDLALLLPPHRNGDTRSILERAAPSPCL